MKRILTAVVLIAFVVSLVFLGKLWMITLLAGAVAILAAMEFRQIAAAGGSPVPLWWTITAIALFFVAVFYRPQDTITVVSLLVLVLFAWNTFRTPLDRVLTETAAGLLILLYIAYPLTLIPTIWAHDGGPALLLFLFFCVWSGDIAALYIGKRYGKRKFAPRLSPNKTWEGAAASVIGSVVFGMAVIVAGDAFSAHGSNITALHTSEPWWFMLITAVILNIAAQFGDLLESGLKRGVGIKDSGTMLPGHGGMLDRIDALLLAAPVFWFIIAIKEFHSPGSF